MAIQPPSANVARSLADSVVNNRKIPEGFANGKFKVVEGPHGNGRKVLRLDVYVNDSVMRYIPGLQGYNPSNERPMIKRDARDDSSGSYNRHPVTTEGYITTRDTASSGQVVSQYMGETPEGWSHHRIELPLATDDSANEGRFVGSLKIDKGDGKTEILDINVSEEWF
jgi:hypothetical protein